MARATSQTTTDHETIRGWVEERGGWPAAVTSTARGAGDTGIIRIDFPGYSGEGKLDRIEWDEWFDNFDRNGLAFVYQDTTAGGEQSNFNKLVAREAAEARAEGEADLAARRRRGGPRRKATAARGGARAAAGGAKKTARPRGGRRRRPRDRGRRAPRARHAAAGAAPRPRRDAPAGGRPPARRRHARRAAARARALGRA